MPWKRLLHHFFPITSSASLHLLQSFLTRLSLQLQLLEKTGKACQKWLSIKVFVFQRSDCYKCVDNQSLAVILKEWQPHEWFFDANKNQHQKFKFLAKILSKFTIKELVEMIYLNKEEPSIIWIINHQFVFY